MVNFCKLADLHVYLQVYLLTSYIYVNILNTSIDWYQHFVEQVF